MTNDPDEIRSNIEATRRELGTDVDALADKVSPSKIAQRQTDKVRDAFGTVRDHLMGSASDSGDTVGNATGAVAGTLGDATGAVADTAQKAKATVEGNALAVGLIAFGVGWLVASLIPASTKEKELAEQVQDAAQPIVDNVASAAKDAAANLKQPAQNAVDAVRETATEAVENVRADATDAADDVRAYAVDAAANVQNQTNIGT